MIDIPVSPHPITFTVYDTDGTTLRQGAKCLVRNCTKKTTSAEATTNASGVAIIDLANLPMGDGQTAEYTAGDVCLLITHYGAKHSHIAARYVIAGSSKSQTLYLKEVPYKGSQTTERILSVVGANTHGSTAYYFKVWAFEDCQLLSHVEVPASDTKPVNYGGRGITGRAVFELENKSIMVTANFK